jgi:hypothetical protein
MMFGLEITGLVELTSQTKVRHRITEHSYLPRMALK